MSESNLMSRITVDAAIFGGKPCIRGHRFTVANLLSLMAQGASQQEILEDHPFLELQDFEACLVYASQQVDHPKVQLAAE